MTDTKVKYEFSGVTEYLNDQGTQIALNPVLSPPTDLSDGQIDEILAAVGATRRTETVPCGDKGNVKPRRLRFIRRNGNSLSVIAPIRSNLITVAETIRDVLNQTNYRVVCIELIGESVANLTG